MKNVLNQIRHWDNLVAKWLIRNFYFLFFEIILVVIFIFWFVNTLNVMTSVADIHQQALPATLMERLVASQTVSQTIMTILFIFNSFWILFIFNCVQRTMTLLKDLNYTILKLRGRDRADS